MLFLRTTFIRCVHVATRSATLAVGMTNIRAGKIGVSVAKDAVVVAEHAQAGSHPNPRTIVAQGKRCGLGTANATRAWKVMRF